ncbi:MAG: hypothetical protein A3I00_02995 [Betaproteobacteria bacterium RIFCSPLOWO2_02_FULL_64_12]|nr:MAG: hypothetical protein A3I00_02995 [Betaproteobacteria bacterium RIFCSPLOWO2_02_FULL_64_12]
MSDEKFASRWSRLKTESRKAETGSPAQSAPPAVPSAAPSPGSEASLPGNEAPLPSLDELKGLLSEYREFLKPGVDENLRRAALKKLFLDPHFNVMDGLDVYIDDYSKADPIPEEMLKNLAHARDLLFKNADPERPEPAKGEQPPVAADPPNGPAADDSEAQGPVDAGPAGGKTGDAQGS